MTSQSAPISSPARMPTNFLSLPGEIRNEIYRHLLLADKRVIPWKDGHDLTPSIIATNKKVQIEASSILYGDNTFFLTPGYPERDRPETFFETIGLDNAAQIRSIRLDFPPVSVTSLPIPAETPVFEQIASATLDLITTTCPNIETVTLTPREMRIVGQHHSPFDLPEGILSFPGECQDQILAMVDARLREIPNLKRIIAEVYSESAGMDKKPAMKALGWEVKDVGPRPDHDSDDEDEWSDEGYSPEYDNEFFHDYVEEY